MAMLQRLSNLFRWLGGLEGTGCLPQSVLPNFRVRAGQHTSIGNFRDNNEDRMYVDGGRGLYVVADGMGGQVAGEQASQLAVDVVPAQLQTLSRSTCEVEVVKDALRRSVLAANKAILDRGDQDPSVQNMGTTVVLALLRGSNIYLAHLGDSRAYLLRDHRLEQKTDDHNLAEALRQSGAITKEECETHRFRHMLWKYLGSKEAVDGPDITVVEARPGDRILLATDGLTGVMDDLSLQREMSRASDPQKCAERLVQLALGAGSKDNVTCVVLFIDPL